MIDVKSIARGVLNETVVVNSLDGPAWVQVVMCRWAEEEEALASSEKSIEIVMEVVVKTTALSIRGVAKPEVSLLKDQVTHEVRLGAFMSEGVDGRWIDWVDGWWPEIGWKIAQNRVRDVEKDGTVRGG